MSATVVTPPAPIVTLEEAKAHLRVDHADEDALITAVVATATAWLDGPDGWLGRALGEQMLEVDFPADGDPADRAYPCPPVRAILAETPSADGAAVTRRSSGR